MDYSRYLNLGYSLDLEEVTREDHNWYIGRVYIPVWHTIFPILPDYELITMMINSPVKLTCANFKSVGFDTQFDWNQRNQRNQRNHRVYAQQQLDLLFHKLVDYENEIEASYHVA
jgi:hypothetical protein